MTTSNRKWTTLDLELFHDEQLEPEWLAQLSGDLRRDGALRERLALVQHIDDELHATLLQPRRTKPPRHFVPLRGFLAAASLVLVVGLLSWWTLTQTLNRPQAPNRLAESATPSAVRIVFSIPLTTERTAIRRDLAVPLPPVVVENNRAFLQRVNRALNAGRVEETLELLAGAPPDRRRSAYRYLGELLQSAQVAEMILDRLSLVEQVAVCGEWVEEPAIRPTVFARLRRLSKEPAVANEVRSLLAEFSADPGLRAWIHGYQL